jgi:hypothetical protein
MTTSIGFSFRFDAVGADAGEAGIGGELARDRAHAVQPTTLTAAV